MSKRNAFYFFMVQRKKDLEEKGEEFPGGLKELAERVGPEWTVSTGHILSPFLLLSK